MIRELRLTHPLGTPIGVRSGEMVNQAVDVPKMWRAIAFTIAQCHAEIRRSMVGVIPRQNHAPIGFPPARVIEMSEANRCVVGAGAGHRIGDMVEGSRRELGELCGGL